MKLLFINLLQVLRHIRRHLGQVILSVVGLVCGLVCFTLSASDLWYQTHYDDFRRDYRHIYCVQSYNPDAQLDKYSFRVEHGRAADLLERIPRGSSMAVSALDYYLSVSTTREEDGGMSLPLCVRYADSCFVDLLDMRVLAGNAKLLDRVPGQAVLTDTLALRLFGTVQAAGEKLYVNTPVGQRTYTVAAVVRKETHTAVQFDYLLSYREALELGIAGDDCEVFIRTDSPESVTRQLAVVDQLHNKGRRWHSNYSSLKPMRICPLLAGNSDLWRAAFYPLSFLMLSFLLLFSAMFNHTALFISMFQEQLHTYRLRQCLGGGFGDNARRLVMELLFIVFAVWLASAVVLELLAPLYGTKMPMGELYMHYACYAGGLLVLLLLFLMWPLLNLRRLYRRSLVHGSVQGGLRTSLLGVQMAVSMLLLFLVVNGYRQFRFMTRDGLGFSIDRVLLVHSVAWNFSEGAAQFFTPEAAATLRNESPAIEDACFFNNRIFRNGVAIGLAGDYVHPGGKGHDVWVALLPSGAADFFKMDIRGWDGNSRSGELAKDEVFASSLLVKRFGLTADDCTLHLNGGNYKVVGILDCRSRSFNEIQSPTLFVSESFNASIGAKDLCVKYQPGRREEAEAAICRLAGRFGMSELEYDVENYTDVMLGYYKEEQHYLMLFGILAAVGLCITLFGVLAMITYELRRSRRDMAVRRIFGAGFRHLCHSYLTAYLQTVAVGALLVLPSGYIVVRWWLQRYDEQITVGLWPVLLTVGVIGLFTTVVVLLCLRRAMREQAARVLQGE